MTATVVLATRNQHKVDELRRILSTVGLDVELVGTEQFPESSRCRRDRKLLCGQRAAEGAGRCCSEPVTWRLPMIRA